MDEKQIQMLKHMLGADSRYKKYQWGFRNHYCSSIGDTDHEVLEAMVISGLVERGVRGGTAGNEMQFYHATKQGAIAAGFKKYQMKQLNK